MDASGVEVASGALVCFGSEFWVHCFEEVVDGDSLCPLADSTQASLRHVGELRAAQGHTDRLLLFPLIGLLLLAEGCAD